MIKHRYVSWEPFVYKVLEQKGRISFSLSKRNRVLAHINFNTPQDIIELRFDKFCNSSEELIFLIKSAMRDQKLNDLLGDV